MRRLAVTLFLLLGTIPFWCQEVVVFEDHRSLVVQSHRVQGEWTYLKIGSGEMAVLSQRVLEIRQEPAGSAASTSSPPSFGAPQPPPGMPMRPNLPPRPGGGPAGFRGGPTRQIPTAAQSNDEEDDEEADEEEPDVEEPPPPGEVTQAPAFPQKAPPVQPQVVQPGMTPLPVPGSAPQKDR